MGDEPNQLPVDHPTSGRRRGKRGPVPKLDRDQIGEAVLQVGLHQVTVAAVAKQLGVAPAGLYRYVSNRDDLIVTAADRVFSSRSFSAADDWVGLLRDEAWARFDSLIEHPGLVRALRSTGRNSPVSDERYLRCIHRLDELGLQPADALLAVDTVFDMVDDGVQQYELLERDIAELGLDAVAQQAAGMGAAYIPVVRAFAADPRTFMGRKLDVVLVGLSHITKKP